MLLFFNAIKFEKINKKSSEDTEIPVGVPVAAGCGDNAAAFTGAGIINEGQMIDSSGTGILFGAAINEFKYDSKYKTLVCMKSPVKYIHYLFSVLPVGKTHKWFIDEFYSKEKEELKDKTKPIDPYLFTLIERYKIPCIILNGANPEPRIFNYFIFPNLQDKIFTKLYSI